MCKYLVQFFNGHQSGVKLSVATDQLPTYSTEQIHIWTVRKSIRNLKDPSPALVIVVTDKWLNNDEYRNLIWSSLTYGEQEQKFNQACLSLSGIDSAIVNPAAFMMIHIWIVYLAFLCRQVLQEPLQHSGRSKCVFGFNQERNLQIIQNPIVCAKCRNSDAYRDVLTRPNLEDAFLSSLESCKGAVYDFRSI